MLFLDPFTQTTMRCSTANVRLLRSFPYVLQRIPRLAMAAAAAVSRMNSGICLHFEICFILAKTCLPSSNQQYHSPFSSVVERGTCTTAQACRGHSFNPGRGHSTSFFIFLQISRFTLHFRSLRTTDSRPDSNPTELSLTNPLHRSTVQSAYYWWRYSFLKKAYVITTWPKFYGLGAHRSQYSIL
jgi:hypothetical protein